MRPHLLIIIIINALKLVVANSLRCSKSEGRLVCPLGEHTFHVRKQHLHFGMQVASTPQDSAVLIKDMPEEQGVNQTLN